MAVLEKIRQRKKILAIVIGGALLAFIVEVAVEALGRNAGNSTAAKVGSEKIDIMDFQKEVEKAAAADQNNPQGQVDQAVRQQQVLEQMISDKLLEKEYAEVGIGVSDTEISELMIGKNAAPAVSQMAQQVGAESPAQLYEFISNPGKFGADPNQVLQLKAQWEELKDNITKQYKMAKLQTLVAGGLQANDLDRAQMMEDESTISHIAFVKKEFASLADDKYPVSDAELKAQWEKDKNLFAIEEENRAIHFIAVSVDPDQTDKNEAQKIADKAYAALQKGRGIDSVRLLGTVKIDTAKVEASKVPANLKDFLTGSAIGSVKKDETQTPGNYVMYKLMNQESSIDSVKVTFVAVPGKKSAQDSALAMLNGGKTIDEVAKAIKGAQGQADQWIQVASYPDSIKSKITGAGSEFFSLISNEQGAQLMKVVEKKAPVTFYTYATVSHEAYASTRTSDNLRNKLQKYINKNKTAADFAKNAAAAGYQAIEITVGENTPQLGTNPYQGIKDSRKAIKWAFENKKGEVSPIFTDNNDYLIVVAIDDVYDGDYLPVTAKTVKEQLTAKVRNAKKGDALEAQYKGKAKNVAEYAKLMGVQSDSTQVIFASDNTAKLENERGIIGRVAAAKQGTTGFYKGENGVYAFEVTKVEKSARKPSKEELNNRFAQSRGAAIFSNPQGMIAVLGKATKVKRDLIKFY
ncbi:MAG: SurA N-terminal domain-containing protein [Muribaculaceae bacterium]|nr:SurA N-terminal domain-containing protein [Muribaculaceae bacterium]